MNGEPKKHETESINCHKCGRALEIGDKICPKCGLVQDSETALKRADYTKDAENFMYGLEVLSQQNADLKALKEKMQEMVNRMMDNNSRCKD
jgi:ribosomal protein L37E